MKIRTVCLSVHVLYAASGVCQQGAAPQQSVAPQSWPVVVRPQTMDSIRVTTTVEPLPLAESDRSVEEISPREMPAGTDSVVD